MTYTGQFILVTIVWTCQSSNQGIVSADVIPKEEVATWISNYHHKNAAYSGYCAHPPVQERTVTSPLTEEEKRVLGNAELVGLQVAFRHGARVPCAFEGAARCFNIENFTLEFDCGIQNRIELKTKSGFGSSGRLNLEPVYPLSIGKCGTGRLQNEAPLQFQAVAKSLKTNYDFEKLGITVETSHCRSDDTPRTQGSMYFLLSALFPEARDIKLRVFPAEADGWSASAECPEVQKEWAPLEAAADLPVVPGPWHSRMAGKWRDAAGTVFRPISHKDCLTEVACTPLPLPGGFTKKLFRWALKKSLQRNKLKWAGHPEITSVLVAPALFDLQDMLKLQTQRRGPKLALWATHDTAIIGLMVSLGMWDGRWPVYAETLVMESYASIDDDGVTQTFFRMILRGHPLKLPGCNSTICPAKFFQTLGRQELRERTEWQKRCKPQHPHVNPVDFAMLGMTPTKPKARETVYVDYDTTAMTDELKDTKATNVEQLQRSKDAAETLGEEDMITRPKDLIIQPNIFGTTTETATVALVVMSSLLGSLVTVVIQRCTRNPILGSDSLAQARERMLPT